MNEISPSHDLQGLQGSIFKKEEYALEDMDSTSYFPTGLL